MQVTAAGFVLLPLCLILAASAPHLIPYLLVAFTAFSATAVVNLTGLTFGLQPTHLLSLAFAVLFVLGVFRIPRTGHSAAVAALLLGFFVAALLSVLSKAVREGATISNFTQLGILANGLVTTAMIAFFCATRERLLKALDVFVWSGVFVAFWGLYQSASGILGLTYPAWIFNSSVSDSADLFAQHVEGLTRISSVAIEPSYFARYAVTACGLALAMANVADGRRRLAYFAAAAVIAFAAAASTSSSAYIGLALLACLWVALDVRRLFAVAAAGTAALVLLTLLKPDILSIVWEMTGSKSSSGSFLERLGTVVTALRRFDDHPLFGHGWDKLASHDLFGALLFHLGIVGWASFLALAVYALVGGLPRNPATDRAGADQTRLSIGLRMVLLCTLGVDAVSGISYVAANLWVLLGLVFAMQALDRSASALRAEERTGEPLPAPSHAARSSPAHA